MRRIPLALLAVLALALAAAATAGADTGGFAPVDPASPNNERIRDLWWFLVGIGGFVFLLVEGGLLWFVFRYRSRRRSRDVEGPQVHGSTRLEQLWTAVPILLLAATAGFTFYKLPGIKNVPGGDRLNVRVEGHQFYWRFVYPGGAVSVDRLVVPLDRVVRLELTAQDVIHSWWVTELGGKIDTVPGRTTSTWFQAKRKGVYRAQCGEFCGIQHAQMRGTVEVVSDAEYEAFLAAHRPESPAVGRESFLGACAKCHGLAGEGDIGPPLRGSALLQDEERLEELMRNGQNRMPGVAENWPDDQVKVTIEYLQRRFGGGQS